MIISFPSPDAKRVREAIRAYLGRQMPGRGWEEILATVLQGRSFSDIERLTLAARRAATVNGDRLERHLIDIVRNSIQNLPRPARIESARLLLESGSVSQRQAYELTGISRDTLRKMNRNEAASGEHSDGRST